MLYHFKSTILQEKHTMVRFLIGILSKFLKVVKIVGTFKSCLMMKNCNSYSNQSE